MADRRLLESGDARLTESGDTRILEFTEVVPPPVVVESGPLTAEQIKTLVQSRFLEIDFGADLLTNDLAFVEEISKAELGDLTGGLVDGSIARNMEARIHGTCRLVLSRSLAWGVDLVRPFMTLTDGVLSERWNLGVFCLVTPQRRVAVTPETFDVDGYDRLMLLDRQVGADYTVTAGTTYRAALLQVFEDAGLSGVLIEGSAADDTVPKDRLWALVPRDEADPDQTDTPVTWLRIVNDLGRAINFRGVWCDRDGQFRLEGYRDPASRPPVFTLDADDVYTTIVGEERTLTEDVWAAPNKWVFRNTSRPDGSPAATEGDGIYTVDESGLFDGLDRLGRPLEWPSVIDYEAATQEKLVELGDRRVADDKRVTSTMEITTGPFPLASHADVFSYVDASVGDRKLVARSWEMSLTGDDVRWKLERVGV